MSEPQKLDATVYGPRVGKFWRFAAVSTGMAIFFLASSGVVGVLQGRPLGSWVSLLMGAFFVALTGLFLVMIARKLPRLVVTASGVTVTGAFAQRSAPWKNLGRFEVDGGSGFYRHRMRTAIAPLAETTSASKSKTFAIQDVFDAPFDDIVADINVRRANAPGAPPIPLEEPSVARRYGVEGFRWPWLTFAILGLLIGVFTWQLARSPGGRLTTGDLLAQGALSLDLMTASGEWYRLLTAPMLHSNVGHILGNGIALVMVGFVLEKLVGRAWFLAIFCASALTGSLASLAVNPSSATSVGASGAIMGLFAASLVVSFRLPTGLDRQRAQARSLRVMIPALLPLGRSTGTIVIDYAAHFGGALGGALLALFLLRTWPAAARLPRFGRVGLAAAATVVLGIVASFGEVFVHYPTYDLHAALIPQKLMPKTQDEIIASADRFLRDYPRDPRSHLYKSLAFAKVNDLPSAESEARAALEQAEHLQILLGKTLSNIVRVELAAILMEEGRVPEAKQVAAAPCTAGADDLPRDKVQGILAQNHLCE